MFNLLNHQHGLTTLVFNFALAWMFLNVIQNFSKYIGAKVTVVITDKVTTQTLILKR
jgi:hypothetical protein